jgi:hypothetical protein
LVEVPVLGLGQDTGYPSVQGGGTDGVHGYAVLLRRTADGDVTRLLRYTLPSGDSPADAAAVKALDYPLQEPGDVMNWLGHGNDIAYDPFRDRLVLTLFGGTNDVAEKPDNHRRLVGFVDPVDLRPQPDAVTGEAVRELAANAFSLCYEPSRQIFAAQRSTKLDFYNNDFSPVKVGKGKSLAIGTLEGTAQGIDCDSDYIYILRWLPDDDTTRIHVFNWQGTLMATYEGGDGEAEHIFHNPVDGSFYLGVDTPGQGGELRRLEDFHVTVSFDPNGGSGEMVSTGWLTGLAITVPTNQFTFSDHRFSGWRLIRDEDGDVQYRDPQTASNTGFYKIGKGPAGWEPALYGDADSIVVPGGCGGVTLRAQWGSVPAPAPSPTSAPPPAAEPAAPRSPSGPLIASGLIFLSVLLAVGVSIAVVRHRRPQAKPQRDLP